jgi:TRAP-type C4-dicarboxylate transport system substrate-binding protein
MKKIVMLTAVFVFGCMVATGTAFPQSRKTLVIKLASLIPENSPWGTALNRIAAEWSRITNGEVELRIYHNGVVGTEGDCVRKLKSNQIQAAILTSFGISLITPEIMTLSAPFFIKNDAELDSVLTLLKPELQKKMESTGFYPIAWAKSGWVRIFSKSPVLVPQDLKKLKMGSSEETPTLTQAFKVMGYQMVPVGIDLILSLNSNKIEAAYQSPVAAASTQLFGIAKNMTDMNIAPIMGGIIFNRTAWRAIPEKYKPDLIKVVEGVEKEITRSMAGLETDAIKTMVSYGLKINQVSPEQEKLWYTEVEKVMPSLVGSTFDQDLYTKISAILKQYRDTH